MTGLDTFLVKFRFTSGYIEAEGLSFKNLLGAFGFVVQLVGIVDLTYWNRQRLLDFVFGKADGKMSAKERADKNVYLWMLAERIWRHSRTSFLLFTVTMLNFSDIDFQKLVLNDRNKQSEGRDERGQGTFTGMI
mmetsp:Transcript_80171/g.221702  ORF Transcript_80171/g.221702 Transcript_80171/m.221702 type:complete len:134 (+) Transcript_80171:64-465(+)